MLVKIICDSIWDDVRLTTFQLEYPRFIHAEMLTHAFARNSSSSRAIPFERQLEKAVNDPVVPIAYLRDKRGMQADDSEIMHPHLAEKAWRMAAGNAAHCARVLNSTGLHHQWTSRLLEPFLNIKTLVTTTPKVLENFFALRCHKDAQPEIQELAWRMAEEYYEPRKPTIERWWHIPFHVALSQTDFKAYDDMLNAEPVDYSITPERVIAAGACARISYGSASDDIARNFDVGLKCLKSGHMSPFEHIAVADIDYYANKFEKPWTQIRKYLPNECRSFDYEEAKKERKEWM